MAELWTQKFFPKNFDEFIGNVEILKEVQAWAGSWDSGKAGKPILFYGQSGSGKTCLAHLVALVNGWDLFELNASDFRSKEVVEKIAGAAAVNSSFSGKKRLVLLDEVDGLQAQDKGGAGAIVSILRESKNPVILTANDVYSDRKLVPIRAIAKLLEFKKINYLSIAKRLKEILLIQNVEFEEEALNQLAKNSFGDFRSALLDVQALSMSGKITLSAVKNFGERLRTEKIFKVMAKIFKGRELEEIRKSVFSSDVSQDLLLRWIEENIPRQFSEEDISNAFEVFSRADVFRGRIIKRQYYGFLRYSNELMAGGVALSRKKDYPTFIPFQFPTILSKLSRSTSVRELKFGIADKIGEKTHSSRKRVLSNYFPFIKLQFEGSQKAVEICAQFNFDEEEVAFLLGSNPKTKKVVSIIEAANKLRAKEIAVKVVLKEEVLGGQIEKFQSEQDQGGRQTTLF